MGPQRSRLRVKVRVSFLILLGCIPATFLSFFAVPLAFSGVFGFLSGDGWLSLGWGIWGLAGTLGTLSLWTISLGFPSPLTYIGLIVGMVANLLVPVLLFSVEYTLSGALNLLFAMAPTIVAVYLLAELLYDASRLGSGNNTDPPS